MVSIKCTQSIKLNSETNFIGLLEPDVPIYISNFQSYSFDQKRIRNKLKVNLQNDGYFIVENIEKSIFYLIFESDCFLNKNITNRYNTLCDMKFILVKTDDRYDYFNSENYLSTIIWRLQVNTFVNIVIKREDELLDEVSKSFLRNT